jgi:predicted nucleic acid-binding protein
MTRAVIDASIVVQLYFEEEYSGAADAFVRRTDELLAPDLILAEVANVVWKRRRRDGVAQEDAAGIMTQVLTLPLRIHSTAGLICEALDLAMRFDRSVYDGIYVALAVRTHSVLVTADRKLVNALAPTPLAKFVTWIGMPR